MAIEATNILPAYDDVVFKTLLTHPDAEAVLRDVISSILMVPVEEVVVRNTETRPHLQKGCKRHGAFGGMVGVFCNCAQTGVQSTHR
jgi:hypothetical protein